VSEHRGRYRSRHENIQINPGSAILVEHREPEQIAERQIAVGVFPFAYGGPPRVLEELRLW
jgi:hypothetical protein